MHRAGGSAVSAPGHAGERARNSEDGWTVATAAGSERYDAIDRGLAGLGCRRAAAPVDPVLGEELSAIPYSSSITINLVYDEATLGPLPDGFGFLVPAVEGRAMLACTFAHRKFLGRTPPGKAVFRAFLGGMRNEHLLAAPDEALVAIVRRELSEILGRKTIDACLEPECMQVSRWRRAMAQYAVGHHERHARIAARAAALPGLRLAGNAYDGIGDSRLHPPGPQSRTRAGCLRGRFRRRRSRGVSAVTLALPYTRRRTCLRNSI